MNKELNEAGEKYYYNHIVETSIPDREAMIEMFEAGAQWQAEEKQVPTLEFAKWLEENTQVIKEEKITLYRYCDKNNEWGNYTLNDIYAEWLDELPQQKQVVTEQEIHAAGLNAAIENGYIDDSYTSAFIKGFKSALKL